MEAILKNVDTALLEDAYTTYVGRVLKETASTKTSEKEGKVLAEGVKKQEIKGNVKSGNNTEQLVSESVIDKKDAALLTSITKEQKDHYRKIAGII
jgi:hypothetical protein